MKITPILTSVPRAVSLFPFEFNIYLYYSVCCFSAFCDMMMFGYVGVLRKTDILEHVVSLPHQVKHTDTSALCWRFTGKHDGRYISQEFRNLEVG